MKKKYLLTLAIICLFQNFSNSQQEEKTDNLDLVPYQGNSIVKVDSLIQLSIQYQYHDFERALEIGLVAKDQAEKTGDTDAKLKSALNLIEIYLAMYRMNKVEEYLNQCRALLTGSSDNKLQCTVLVLSGKYHALMGEIELARNEIREAYLIAENNGYLSHLISCNNILGNMYQNLGIYDRSTDYYYIGLEIAEQSNSIRDVQKSLFNVGYVLTLNEKYEDARVYYDRALEISNQLEDKKGMQTYYHEIGVWYQKQDQLEEALSMFEKALQIAYEVKDTVHIAILLGNTGSTTLGMGKPDKALEKLFMALELKRSIQRDPSHTYNDLTDSYLMLNDLENAKLYSEKAIESSIRNNNQNQLTAAKYRLSQYYFYTQDYKNAYDQYKEYIELKDSLFNLQKSHQIESIKTQYETEKKEEQISFLNQQHKAEKFRRNALAGLSGLILVIGILLINRQRLKTKEQRALYEKGQEVERLKSRFFANITHELRTPLTLILGPLEILKSHISRKEDQQQLNVLDKNANRLLELINQMLDLSKIEAGKLKLQVEPYDIVQLVNRVAGLFESVTQLKNINLKVENHLNNSILNIDVDKIEKVIVNLMSNALKFTPEYGFIQITLMDENNEKNEKHVKSQGIIIKVKDSGQGILTEDLEYVFDQYFQSADSLNKEYTGTGIGLALAKELVELHHGKISVKSESGKGATFTILFPSAIISSDVAHSNRKNIDSGLTPIFIETENTEFNSEPSSVSGNQEIVLIVEDNIEVSNYIRSILNKKYNVAFAREGQEGFEKAIKQIPDLVISDVMMPGMNGFELCEKLKTDEKTSHIPVILLTARGSSEDKIRGLENQADVYLVKPFIPKELLSHIENLIELRKQLRERFSKEFVFKPGEIQVNSVDDLFLERLNSFVEEHIEDEDLGVDDLAGLLNMGRSQLNRKVKALTNLAPNEFIRNYRLLRAMELIKGQAGTKAEIAFAVGFSSPSYFTRCFREHFGFPPSEVLNKTSA